MWPPTSPGGVCWPRLLAAVTPADAAPRGAFLACSKPGNMSQQPALSYHLGHSAFDRRHSHPSAEPSVLPVFALATMSPRRPETLAEQSSTRGGPVCMNLPVSCWWAATRQAYCCPSSVTFPARPPATLGPSSCPSCLAPLVARALLSAVTNGRSRPRSQLSWLRAASWSSRGSLLGSLSAPRLHVPYSLWPGAFCPVSLEVCETTP